MSLNDTDKHKTAKSPLQEAQEKGQVQIGGEPRKIVTGDRKTAKGKEAAKEAEEKRRKEAMLFKATLKKNAKAGGDKDEEEWEDESGDSVEGDFPHVKLEELLDNLKLDDPNEIEGDQL